MIKMLGGSGRMFQDLRAINETVDLDPPHSPQRGHTPSNNTFSFMMLDFQDAFFWIPVHPGSPFLFAFK